MSLPDKLLKLPEGHDAHVPDDAPPQPLRYSPAAHDEAEQVEQTDDPGIAIMMSRRLTPCHCKCALTAEALPETNHTFLIHACYPHFDPGSYTCTWIIQVCTCMDSLQAIEPDRSTVIEPIQHSAAQAALA